MAKVGPRHLANNRERENILFRFNPNSPLGHSSKITLLTVSNSDIARLASQLELNCARSSRTNGKDKHSCKFSYGPTAHTNDALRTLGHPKRCAVKGGYKEGKKDTATKCVFARRRCGEKTSQIDRASGKISRLFPCLRNTFCAGEKARKCGFFSGSSNGYTSPRANSSCKWRTRKTTLGKKRVSTSDAPDTRHLGAKHRGKRARKELNLC